jgi:hypothetical protein
LETPEIPSPAASEHQLRIHKVIALDPPEATRGRVFPLERWSKVQVRTNLTGTLEFTDAHAIDSPTRFYRVLVP